MPWFADVCQHLAAHTVSLTFIAQAYAELLQNSCQHDVAMVQHFHQTGDAAAVHLLQELSAGQQDVDATLGLIIPAVMSSDGHVPNQLQDFLLQVFGGYRLASNLDAAATHFRNTGSWQECCGSARMLRLKLRVNSRVSSILRLALPLSRRLLYATSVPQLTRLIHPLSSPLRLCTHMLAHAIILLDSARNDVVLSATHVYRVRPAFFGVRIHVVLWLANPAFGFPP